MKKFISLMVVITMIISMTGIVSAKTDVTATKNYITGIVGSTERTYPVISTIKLNGNENTVSVAKGSAVAVSSTVDEVGTVYTRILNKVNACDNADVKETILGSSVVGSLAITVSVDDKLTFDAPSKDGFTILDGTVFDKENVTVTGTNPYTVNVAVKDGVKVSDLTADKLNVSYSATVVTPAENGEYNVKVSFTGKIDFKVGDDVLGTMNFTSAETKGTITTYTQSSGGSSKPTTTTETVKNEDGSTTTTVINNKTGTVTETTENTDGSTITVETKKDGTVTTTEKDADGNKTTTVENADGSTKTEEKLKDGTTITTETTKDGETTITVDTKKETEVEIPVKDSENVSGIVITDKNGNQTTITDFEVTDGGVKFTVSGKYTVEVEKTQKEPVKEFDDVQGVSHWAKEAIEYVVSKGLMNGVSENEFAPDMSLTRAMLVTVLYRLTNEPETNVDVAFGDVADGSYYEKAVKWAQENGIVNGITENEFAPDVNITREQIATILYRYAKYMGYDVTQGGMQIREFADYEEISDYALEAMTWAVNVGLVKGRGNNNVAPKDFATRAEIATILQRFIQLNK